MHTRSQVPPFVIGHRGAAGLAPENTLVSIRRARAEGATWVELDVMLTADAVPVLMHDPLLGRTNDGRGKVAETSLAALKALDAGAWFGPEFAGERVPTLAETFAVLAEEGLGANIEIKPAPGYDRETAETVALAVARDWPAELPAPVISSFSLEAMTVVHDRLPDVARAMLFGRLPTTWPAMLKTTGAQAVHLADRLASERRISALRDAGFPVRVYTVNDPTRADRLRALGVQSVFTDRPDVIRD